MFVLYLCQVTRLTILTLTQLGDFGLSGGGAAGFELDRADTKLGTPQNAVVLARSMGHSDTFIPVYEEMLTHVSTESGLQPEDLVHADIVIFETPGGGAVFSTGSITFCGSLSHSNYQNNISHLLRNVLRHFSRDEGPGIRKGTTMVHSVVN